MNWNFLPSRKCRVVLTLLAMTAQLVFGQTSTTGAIRGTVTDTQGAVIAGATVEQEAATRLQISIWTVKSHRINISRKLRFNSIAKLVHYAIRHGIVAQT